MTLHLNHHRRRDSKFIMPARTFPFFRILSAAALLIFSQIFKKPLQEVSQVYYSIGGTWDEPALERTDAANFASHGELAGCLASTE